MTSSILKQLTKYKNLAVLGACMHSGQPIKGVELGPAAVRKSGIFEALSKKYGVKVHDFGDVHEVCEKQVTENDKKKYLHPPTHLKNLHLIDPSLQQISKRISHILSKDLPSSLTLTIGGDHSIASATIHGLLGKYPDLKVIWVDAHADMLDPSLSDYPGYHGMPLSHILGICDGKAGGFEWMGSRRLRAQNVVHIGLRDIDSDQWGTIRSSKVKCFTPDHVDDIGIGNTLKKALQHLKPSKDTPFHISFDIDGIDPQYCGATGTKFRGGLTPRQANFIVRKIAHQCNLVSMDLVEINPLMEESHNQGRDRYRGEELYADVGKTVGMGVDLIDSVFQQYLTL